MRRAASSAVLDALRRHGCASADALALALGIARDSVHYAAWSLWRRCEVEYYPLPYGAGAWCAGGPPRRVAATCDGRLVELDVAGIAAALAGAIAGGARGIKPARFARRELGLDCSRGAALRVAAGIVAALLDGSALRDRRDGVAMYLVTDPRAAIERLRRAAETGVAPLRPAPRPDGCARREESRRKMVIVTLRLPRGLLAIIDALVERGAFPSRTAALRAAAEELVRRYAGGGA
jgi:hypothetical protein